jgi:hypothetical protein
MYAPAQSADRLYLTHVSIFELLLLILVLY